MLSRVAENLYWMVRYLERAENTARLVNTTAHLLLDSHGRSGAVDWPALITILGADQAFEDRYQTADEASVTRFLIGDRDNPSSIVSSLVVARENARTLREVLPREFWEEINDLYLYARHAGEFPPKGRRRYDFLRGVIRRRQTLIGLANSTLRRDAVHHFMRLGRNLERADMTTRLLDVAGAGLLDRGDDGPDVNLHWMALLDALGAQEMYRGHVGTRVRGRAVLAFLLLDQQFPRSPAFCLEDMTHCLNRLPNPAAVVERVWEMDRQVLSTDVPALLEGGLHQYLDELQQGFGQIHTALAATYFGPGPAQPQAA